MIDPVPGAPPLWMMTESERAEVNGVQVTTTKHKRVRGKVAPPPKTYVNWDRIVMVLACVVLFVYCVTHWGSV